MQKLESIVKQQPHLGAAKLKVGNVGGNLEPVTNLDPLFNNIDLTNHLRRKTLKQTGADGIQSSHGALLQWVNDCPEPFIVNMDLTPGRQIISMQTQCMKQVLNETA